MRARSLVAATALVAFAIRSDALGDSRPGSRRDPRDDVARLRDELAAAKRTRELVAEKLAQREADLRGRVRVLYKLARSGDLPLWVDTRERAELARRRGAARRMILRDLDERRLLREELARAEADEERLVAEAGAAAIAAARPLEPDSFAWPVSGDVVARFGSYVDRPTKLRLVRRGVELACDRYEDVLSVGAGTVLYAGPLRNLDKGVVVDHGDGIVSVTARLVHVRVETGYRVDEAVPIGDAASDRIYLEIRRGGRPVDPEPLLRADD